LPVANAAFFVEGARPVTQTRIRWDSGIDLIRPDIAEYFWARADGSGRGPKPAGPFLGETRLNYNDLSLYTEAATGKIGVIFEMPYRMIQPERDSSAGGFGDMNIGMKTLLFDCELLQISMIMRTYMPVGDTTKGLGTGHVSLEPSLVVGLCLREDSYFQGQVSEWIPLGGDPTYAGSIMHYHFSFNQVLYRVLPNVPLVGTAELNGWTFQNGDYTDPIQGGLQRAEMTTYLSAGLGLRLFVCDSFDFGVGFATALTTGHFADQLYRTELRFRY
jgi:hypothetical protein